MSLTLTEVTELLSRRGASQYGKEAVNQLEHALQCAHLAEQAGENAATIAAALLHDVGHLLAAERAAREEHDTSKDDLHQYIALPFLRGLFTDAVLEPIRLHVDAKRYLCFSDASYWASLSAASQHSLAQQGGMFSEAEADAFLAQPFASEAIRLRRYDDLAKVGGMQVPGLAHYAQHLQEALI